MENCRLNPAFDLSESLKPHNGLPRPAVSFKRFLSKPLLLHSWNGVLLGFR